jgi:hypothetical protein
MSNRHMSVVTWSKARLRGCSVAGTAGSKPRRQCLSVSGDCSMLPGRALKAG